MAVNKDLFESVGSGRVSNCFFSGNTAYVIGHGCFPIFGAGWPPETPVSGRQTTAIANCDSHHEPLFEV